jgi:hypothetical protein
VSVERRIGRASKRLNAGRSPAPLRWRRA